MTRRQYHTITCLSPRRCRWWSSGNGQPSCGRMRRTSSDVTRTSCWCARYVQKRPQGLLRPMP